MERVKALYHRHRRWVPILFFIAGFIFDALMLQRIDDILTIVQQGTYLLIAATLIGLDLLEQADAFHPPHWVLKPWQYREAAIHFMLGTLLNGYTIFYFKSASVITSFVFVGLLVIVLTLNEFQKFGRYQGSVHVALLSLCVFSYFVYLIPILMGYIGTLPFLGAAFSSALTSSLVYFFLKRGLGSRTYALGRRVAIPFLAVHGLFIGLYFIRAIPPVPLSVRHMGIYHDVKKENGKYTLTHFRPKWKFWQTGDQSFLARPGDQIFCFARIFSPSRFTDKMQVRWYLKGRDNHWIPSDAIPLPIVGGRDEGFRGFTVKNNYQPGDWRVAIETSDGREVGRLTFTVANDETFTERTPTIEIQ